MIKNNNYTEIFIAVAGRTPQIITECIYYYYHEHYSIKRKFDRIKIFTTTKVYENLIYTLFDNGKLNDLKKTLQITDNSIPFEKSDIILFKDSNGKPLEDLKTTQSADYATNILYEEIKRWTKIDNTRITATIAGGRKSMAASMALAFQLYAREHDELIHIMSSDNKME